MKRFIIFFSFIIFALYAGGILGKTLQSEDTRLEKVAEKIIVADKPTSTSIPLFKPTEMRIPKLDIQSPIEYVGMDAKGNMDVPKDDMHVAWFEPGFLPGASGNAVLAGHFDQKNGGPAIFYHLGDLEKGDEILITDQNAKVLTFVVTNKNSYPVNNFPIPTVFGPSDKRYLNLVTCGGVWDPVAKLYADRLVVRTELRE